MTQSGSLLTDKPQGPSSAQVVGRIKAISGAKKLGHLGTLDPFASGLLLVGVNEGTKIAAVFLGGVKSYRAVMILGLATDTQDSTGKVVEERPVATLVEADLRRLEQDRREPDGCDPCGDGLGGGGLRRERARRGAPPREARGRDRGRR